MRANIANLNEENKKLLENEDILKEEMEKLTRARDNLKEQIMELKEVNKELKSQFKELEGQVSECIKEGRIREEKENEIPKQKAALMGEIHGLIQQYRKNNIDKRALRDTNYSSS